MTQLAILTAVTIMLKIKKADIYQISTKVYMKPKLKAGQEANYKFYEKASPDVPMGQGEFANMPERPIITTFSRKHDHRDGITNSFTTDVELVSNLEENR